MSQPNVANVGQEQLDSLTQELATVTVKKEDIKANIHSLMDSLLRRKETLLAYIYEALEAFENKVYEHRDAQSEDIAQMEKNLTSAIEAMQTVVSGAADEEGKAKAIKDAETVLSTVKNGFEVKFLRSDIPDVSVPVRDLVTKVLVVRTGRVVRHLSLGFHINSMTVTKDKELVIATGTSADRVPGGLRALDFCGKVLKNINIRTTYSGVTSNNDGGVIATSQSKNKVEFWKNGKKGTTFKVCGAKSLWEVALAQDGRIFVADFAAKKITVHKSDGSVVHTIMKNSSNKYYFKGPENIASSNNRLYVTDCTLHVIMCFDQNYSLEWTYGKSGEEGRGPGRLNKPRGIAIDSSGRLIVADYGNDRLIVLTECGDLIGYVQDEVHHPNKVCMAPDGKVVVLERAEVMPRLPMIVKVCDVTTQWLDKEAKERRASQDLDGYVEPKGATSTVHHFDYYEEGAISPR